MLVIDQLYTATVYVLAYFDPKKYSYNVKLSVFSLLIFWGTFNNYVDNIMQGGCQKMSVFVHTQGIKTVLAGVGGLKNGKILST